MKRNGETAEELVEVYVWDRPTRILHWMNAILVLTLLFLAVGFELMEELGVPKEARESLKELHAYVGLFFVVTLSLRIIWGFAGNRYARWSDVIPWGAARWRDIWGNIRWLLSGLRGAPPVAVGHNPLASLFYCALFVVLIGQAVTGLVLAGEHFDMLPGRLLAAVLRGGITGYAYAHEVEHVGDGTEESALVEGLEELHEFGFYFIIFFIAAHLAGLVLHEIGERRGLLSSMITGRKYFRRDELDKLRDR